jgi:hypothetical protein
MAYKNTTVTIYGSGFYAFLGKEKLLANNMFDRGLSLERDLSPLRIRFNGFPVGAANSNDWPVEIVTDTVLRCTLTFRHDPPPRQLVMGQQMRPQNRRIRVGLYLSDTGEETNYLEVDIRRPTSVMDFGPSRKVAPTGAAQYSMIGRGDNFLFSFAEQQLGVMESNYPYLWCRIGDVVTDAKIHNNTAVKCRIPPAYSSNSFMQLINTKEGTSSGTYPFTYLVTSEIFAVDPVSWPCVRTPKKDVVLRGTNFPVKQGVECQVQFGTQSSPAVLESKSIIRTSIPA